MRRYLRFAAAGMQLALTLVILILGGRWLDRKFPRLEPLFTLAGALIGIVGGMASLILQVIRSNRS